MDENKLLKIALIFTLLGILLILFLSESMSIPLTKISDISKDNLDEKVKIRGTLTRVTETGNITILNIKDTTGEITILLFDENPNLEKNQEAEILGTITEYEDQLEIIADQIKTI